MCFELISRSDTALELPYHPHEFKVFESNCQEPLTADEVIDYAVTQARIALDVIIANMVTVAAEAFGNIVKINGDESIPEPWERSVVICSKAEQRELDDNIVHPDIVYSTSALQLDNRVIVLQLKDFSYLAQYAFNAVTSPRDLEPGCLVKLQMQVKINTDATQGVIYERVRAKRGM